MYFPAATYRIQTSSAFQLKQIREIISYLDALGISTIYSAPFFQASKGSTHGYDVVNPHKISDEIGDKKQFISIVEELKRRNMGWLQDIVPNHMAFSAHNPWIRNVLELGPHSPYYEFFDINWVSEDKPFFGKVMMPFLGSPLEEVLHRLEIQLAYGENGFYFSYFDHEFPLCAESYYPLLQKQSGYIKDQNPGEEVVKDFFTLLAELDKWNKEEIHEDQLKRWQSAKQQLQAIHQKSEVIRNAIQDILDHTNRDWHTLKHLLFEQNYQLSYWKDTESEINYRRFFTVNDLICLNIHEPLVFEEYHRFIKELVDEGLVQGLRVDHVDGLFDPSQYLDELRKLAGNDTYLIVEKILEAEEYMPDSWPIQGTSGYEFLAQVSQLFTHQQGKEKLTNLYKLIAADLPSYRDLVYQNKMFILLNHMGGELNNLMDLLKKLDIIPYQDTEDDEKQKQALSHLLAAFPVYRIYGNRLPLSDQDMKIIGEAFALAESKAPSLGTYFQRLREVFNGVPDRDEQQNDNRLYFVMRCQQFTGPLAAKGVEDTTFYVYNPLISHNEVGDTPSILGISTDEFHQKMIQRNPQSINTTATHDTKRGEDARLRINVLSEIPEEWETQYQQWKETNHSFLTKQAGKHWPDENDEYFLYQTLVGTYPVHVSPEQENYQERLKDYMLKAIKESKRNTNWSSPNEDYEKAMASFVDKIVGHKPFIEALEPFVRKVAQRSAIYSLGQTLLKVTAPGIPDVYQGTEYWDLSMVDPDNRRPVNYEERTNKLKSLNQQFQDNPQKLINQLGQNLLDPTIKLFTLTQALQARRVHQEFFLSANYQAVNITGEKSNSVLAFLRNLGEKQAIMVVPMHVSALNLKDNLPVGKDCWQDTSLQLAEDSTGEWINIFTHANVSLHSTTLVSQILNDFPVAFLIKK